MMKKLIKSKPVKITIFILIIILTGCSNDNSYDTCQDESFQKLSKLVVQYEEMTRIRFGYQIVEEHLKSPNSNYLNKGILELTLQVDSLVAVLFMESGGQDYNGQLLGGCNKSLTSKSLKESGITKKLEKTISSLKERNKKEPVFNGDAIIEDLEYSLNFFNKLNDNPELLENTTVLVFMFQLIMYNNYLLLIETEYFDTLNQCE